MDANARTTPAVQIESVYDTRKHFRGVCSALPEMVHKRFDKQGIAEELDHEERVNSNREHAMEPPVATRWLLRHAVLVAPQMMRTTPKMSHRTFPGQPPDDVALPNEGEATRYRMPREPPGGYWWLHRMFSNISTRKESQGQYWLPDREGARGTSIEIEIETERKGAEYENLDPIMSVLPCTAWRSTSSERARSPWCGSLVKSGGRPEIEPKPETERVWAVDGKESQARSDGKRWRYITICSANVHENKAAREEFLQRKAKKSNVPTLPESKVADEYNPKQTEPAVIVMAVQERNYSAVREYRLPSWFAMAFGFLNILGIEISRAVTRRHRGSIVYKDV
ncbi:hypothetical protein C8R45DRAFT_1156722 [Mycena sanguinolenta]|nr:hypothetical protein C8R45DRAFT_1156722 [Mycena sanguinolenta]